MKISVFFLIISFFVHSGCEDDKKETNSQYASEKIGVVSAKSTSVIGGEPNDIYQYDIEGWRVIVNDKTKIYVQRESCSGLESASPQEINIGFTILVRYYADESDYIGSPNKLWALSIEAYRPSCL